MKFCAVIDFSYLSLVIVYFDKFCGEFFVCFMHEKKKKKWGQEEQKQEIVGHQVENSRECVLVIETVQMSAKLKDFLEEIVKVFVEDAFALSHVNYP